MSPSDTPAPPPPPESAYVYGVPYSSPTPVQPAMGPRGVGFAIASLSLALLGWILQAPIFPILRLLIPVQILLIVLAIIFGHISLNQANRAKANGPRIMAIIGLVLGYLGGLVLLARVAIAFVEIARRIRMRR